MVTAWLLAAAVGAAEPCAGPAAGSPFPPVALQKIAEGLDGPLDLVTAHDGSGRLFVVEQEGRIKIWRAGRVLPTPFLDINERVKSGGEMGLLGLAFHPQFRENGRFFVNYTSSDGGLHTVIAEFHADPASDTADPKSERTVLTYQQPYENHNGGNVMFGPDGMLYNGAGDGGSGNDPHNNGQSYGTFLGKFLRIDVDHRDPGKAYAVPKDNPFVHRKGAYPEIWAIGMRNPWRWSFDRATGRLWCGDVGQNKTEEVDVIEKGKNYGWRIMEGSHRTPGVEPERPMTGLTGPVFDYERNLGYCVTGGYVYRGGAIPGLCGTYVFADYGSGRIFGLRYDGKKMTKVDTLLQTKDNWSSFGEDEAGELYAIDHSGGHVYRLVAPEALVIPQPDADGFTPLFDATHTDGWVQAGPGGFTVADGVATSFGGMGLWYYARRSYQDFTLRLEFRQKTYDSNSGVFVRFPRVDGDPWLPVNEGHEIQIYGNEVGDSHTGSVYKFAAPTSLPLKAPGEWNAYEITCVGRHYTVALNGTLITTYDSPRALCGMIGLQNHCDDEPDKTVSFRNVRIKER